MARTNLPQTAWSPNGSIAAPTATAIDAVNGMNVQVPNTGVPAASTMANCILQVSNTAAAAYNVTIDAGVGGGPTPGPAYRSGKGSLIVNVPASSTVFIGPFESARFAQLDGSLNIDFQSGMTGTITAFVMPARWS